MRFGAAIATAVLAFLTGCGHVREADVVDRSSAPARPRVPVAIPAPRVPAPAAHVVVAGDTLYSIAFRHRVDVRELAGWNRIAPPYTIYPGRRLRLEAPARARDEMAPAEGVQTFAIRDSGASAPAIPSSPAPAPRPATPLVTGTSPPGAAPLPRPATATPPPRVTTPAPAPSRPVAATPRPAPSTSPAVTPAAPAASATPPPTAAPIVTAPVVAVPKPATPVIVSTGPARSAGGVNWRWPAGGRVAQRFVPGDAARQGIDIVGQAGQPVLAAADGEVVYSGNGLLGYGELIIVKHSADFLSAYGHNRTRLVAEGSRVKAGQQIAEMGQTGASLHLLHFEIRRSGKPVDPLGYLPAR